MRVELSTDTSDPEVLEQLLQWLSELNFVYLMKHPHTPPLYRSGVSYRREPRQVVRSEKFAGIGEVLEQGWGDCDDLAPWRAAELQMHGIAARPRLVDASHPAYRDVSAGKTKRVWHVVVERETGPGTGDIVFEDPSARLGMYGV